MTFLDHLTELRSRVAKSLAAVLLASIVGFIYCKEIFHFLQIPLLVVLPKESHFIVTTPFESYTTYFKVGLFSGLFLAIPFIFYQFWQFISPALERKEKRHLVPFTILSAILFLGGALFGYFVVFPAGFYYVNFILEGTNIELLPKMSDYLKLSMMLLITFGITFELPLMIYLLGKMGLLTPSKIGRYRRYVIVCLFAVAAMLTPGPDVLSQCLLAIPLWVLYELGGLSLRFMKSAKEG